MPRTPQLDHDIALEVAASGRRVTRYERHDGRIVRIRYDDVSDGFARLSEAVRELPPTRRFLDYGDGEN